MDYIGQGAEDLLLYEMVRGFLVGLVQGFLEWVPVSSSGNVYLSLYFIGLSSPGYDYSIFLHLPTAIAGAAYFHREIMKKRYIEIIPPTLVLSYIFGIPIYLLFSEVSRSVEIAIPVLVGLFLILTGVLESRGVIGERENSEEVAFSTWLVAGLIQGLSALPGLSRSGITIAYLLYRGFPAREAFKISFLIGIPFTGLSGLGLTFLSKNIWSIPSFELLIAFMTALFSSIIMLRIMMEKIANYSFWKVCVLLGLLSLLSLIFFIP